MTEVAPKLTLTYYRFSGSAETFRLAAAIGKIRFTNKAIEKDAWVPPPGKEGDPRYQLPVLEIEVKGQEEQVIANRNAILHYLGRRGGLYPTDPLEGLQIEYMLETVSEALKPLELSNDGVLPTLLSEKPMNNEQLLRIRQGIAKDSEYGLPLYLQFFEKALRENYENKESKWLVGRDISIADLKLYHLVCWISGGIGDGDGPSLLKGIDSSLIGNYPLLLKHKMQIETLPEVVAWRAKYTPPYSVFEHRPPYEFRSIGRRSRLGNHHTPVQPTVGRINPDKGVNATRGRWNASVPRLTLTYFETAGKAEPIRLAAAVGKIPFTNRSVSQEEWSEMKRFSPLQQLPTLTVVEPGKDLVIAPQSTAILKYIGKLGGLYPAEEIEAVQLEFFIETIAHASRLIEMTTSGVAKTLILDVLFTEDEKLHIIQKIMSDRKRGLPMYLNYFESILRGKKETDFLIGTSLTVADFALYRLFSLLNERDDNATSQPSLLLDYPLIREHHESIERHARVQRFRARYKPPYSTFEFIPGQDEAENFDKMVKDSIPRMAGRRTSSGSISKNVSRSKSSDSIPRAATRHPGFAAPSPAKRRGSAEEDDLVANKLSQDKDKMMAPPLRRKPSFDDEVTLGSEDSRRRGSSLPPMPRPVSIIDVGDDDDDDCFSLSEGSSDYDDFDVAAVAWSSAKMKPDEFVDDSSTDSYDVRSSISSADLRVLRKRLQPSLEGKKETATSRNPAPYNWKANKKRIERKEKSKASRSSSKGLTPPKLPANIPRNRPSPSAPRKGSSDKIASKPKKESKKMAGVTNTTESRSLNGKREGSDGPMYEWAEMNAKKNIASKSCPGKGSKSLQLSAKAAVDSPVKAAEQGKTRSVKVDADVSPKKKIDSDLSPKKKSISPKPRKQKKKSPSSSPKGRIKKLPSNNPRGQPPHASNKASS